MRVRERKNISILRLIVNGKSFRSSFLIILMGCLEPTYLNINILTRIDTFLEHTLPDGTPLVSTRFLNRFLMRLLERGSEAVSMNLKVFVYYVVNKNIRANFKNKTSSLPQFFCPGTMPSAAPIVDSQLNRRPENAQLFSQKTERVKSFKEKGLY